MELNVKGSGVTKSFQLKGIEPSLTVGELKKKCKEECGLEPDQQRLFLKGKLLKDEDTLEVAKIGDKATLFLVKGASGSGSSGSTEKKEEAKEEKKEEEAPAATVLCVGGCGFYGTAKTENYCSKCYAKKQQTEQADAEKPKKEAEKPKEAESEEAKEGGEAAAAEAEAEPEKEEQKDKTKCWFCGKKCGLTGFECRCGYVFCSKHRYAEDHNCCFDHKGKGREILAKNNPNIAVKGSEMLDGI